MGNPDVERSWQELAEEVLLGIKEWRLQHPKATLKEIEEALDGSWAKTRARIVRDLALASAAKDLSGVQEDMGYLCPQCEHPLESRGQKTRRVITYYDQNIDLKRSYGVCPSCGTGLFPPG
jgi:hypothetical protein